MNNQPSTTLHTPFLDDIVKNRPQNHDGAARRMGVEIELAGLNARDLSEELRALYGGKAVWKSPYEVTIENTDLGDFIVELDAQSIKEVGNKSKLVGDPEMDEKGLEKFYLDLLESISSQLVPWEIVSPPIDFAKLPRLFDLVENLNERGAKGTKASIRYAFGVHLNPELTTLDSSNITQHLKSFFCLYDWIMSVEKPDFARLITPYIDHFDKEYIRMVVAEDYQPQMGQLIDDYLAHNPTRNRNLDMLPMFAFIDEERVRAVIDDPRVKARPTFHYRLPNCEIASPKWNLDRTLETWFAVEMVAIRPILGELCHEYLAFLSGDSRITKAQWIQRVGDEVETIKNECRGKG